MDIYLQKLYKTSFRERISIIWIKYDVLKKKRIFILICRTLFFERASASPDYAKTKRVADRAQRVRKSVHRAEGSNGGSASHSTRGQDLSDQWQPVALTAGSDGERLLRPRTNMFRQRVAPRMRMRTCNALRNTYARDERRERTWDCRIIFVIDYRIVCKEPRIPVARLNGSRQLVNSSVGLTSARLP